ncbi:MAG TPA: TIGR03619 family F420-dependent LLM class oxidoreductase [Candidatus Sulfomarinibacteraceae bacterium]|nr:TIGR03619 family F420-dependent LLM class oxidoreductase [Candidatus Sulfomarinibacteraceae bacterium]
MDFGLILPSLGDEATHEGIDAAGEIAERLGFTDAWTTDHLLVDRSAAEDYGTIFEAVTTLAYLAGRTTKVRLGASVIVVPMRNAVVLAKELATIDNLSAGRLIAGVGVGWSRPEFASVGVADRFAVRGAYTDEAIRLWRHLWSGADWPFHGRFTTLDDYVFGPLPAQGGALPIWIGGRSEAALRRAGRLADTYHASATSPAAFAPRVPVIRAAADEAGRPMPGLSARVRVHLGATGPADGYAMRGSADDVAAEVRAFAALGIGHLALAFPSRDPDGLAREAEAFVREVVPLV